MPTLAEAGLERFEMTSWQGFFVPAKTPHATIDTIHRHKANALKEPELRDRIIALGQDPVGNSPDELTVRVKSDAARFARIITDARIATLD